ncbi:MAG: hypothetical protein M3Y49_18040 [Actinomycetota bacterium]|nr:hypothetical protein [Actinomycetota bacterium]
MPTDADHVVSPGAVDRLMAARGEYKREVSVHYDDVLTEVSNRVKDAGSVGKADVGVLVMWKRMRADTPWAGEFMALPEDHVRAVTARAARCVQDRSLSVPEAAVAGRRELSGLPGFTYGDALASAVLLVAAPTRMAIYDHRAQAGLKVLDLTLSARPPRRRYGRYMHLVEQLRGAVNERGNDWLARDVDLALFQLGK